MRTLDLYWKSNRDWWFYDKNLIPLLRVTAPPEAQKSYIKYRLEKGCSVCTACLRMQKFYNVGKCPECGTDGLLMNVKTHLAVCTLCGSEFGIPLAITGLCYNDVLFNHYDFTFHGHLSKESILAASKILGINTAQLYKALKNSSPVKRELNYRQSLTLKKLLSPLGVSFSTSPELIEYEKYNECWKSYHRE